MNPLEVRPSWLIREVEVQARQIGVRQLDSAIVTRVGNNWQVGVCVPTHDDALALSGYLSLPVIPVEDDLQGPPIYQGLVLLHLLDCVCHNQIVVELTVVQSDGDAINIDIPPYSHPPERLLPPS